MREYSQFVGRDDEPCYLVNTAADWARLLAYPEMADREPGVQFGGRLGMYKYLDMHIAIASAPSKYDNRLCSYSADKAVLTSQLPVTSQASLAGGDADQ
jgi:UDP-galactopyranose mutase